MLTNEQAKQEAIKKTYEECGIELGDFKPEQSNWSRFVSVSKPELCDITDDREILGYCRIRPKSLKNLDKNNGWIRIEPDGSNLPYHPTKSYKTGILTEFDFEESYGGCNAKQVNNRFESKKATHYKPIEPELKPIY